MDIYSLSGHLAFLLIAFSFLVKDILFLRVLSVIASLAGILYNYYIPVTPLWLVINWNIIFILVNIFQISVFINEKRGVKFSEVEKELYDVMFKGFSPIEYNKLLRLGTWENASPGDVICTQGEMLDSVILIYNGILDVFIDDKNLCFIKDGSFIGEMSYMTNNNASATVISKTDVKYISWEKEKLKDLVGRNPSIKFSFQELISIDLTKKLAK